MTKWYIYNEAGIFTGGSVDCPESHLDQNVPEGYGCYMGEVDPLSQRIDIESGELMEYQPPQPSANHQWTEQKRWVYVDTLEDIKIKKQAAITAAYLLANVTSFTFQGKEIQANEHSMKQIYITDSGITRRGGLKPNWLGFWKTLDNSYVAIPDVATWNAFYDSIEETGTANYLKAQVKKARISAATTIEEVDAITWESVE